MGIFILSDKEKFKVIYEQYNRLMFLVALDIVKQDEDAKEAVQEAFLRIAQNISKICEPICPKTRNFVVIIVRNTALDIAKKNNKIKVTELKDEIPDKRKLVNPEQVSEETDALRIVVEEIRSLPSRYRECMYMELIEELSYEEIADMMELKNDTVRKRLQRGKKLLRKKLKERGVTYGD